MRLDEVNFGGCLGAAELANGHNKHKELEGRRDLRTQARELGDPWGRKPSLTPPWRNIGEKTLHFGGFKVGWRCCANPPGKSRALAVIGQEPGRERSEHY